MVAEGPDIGFLHDWIAPIGGAEKELEQLAILYPGSDLYTIFDLRGKNRTLNLDQFNIHTSSLNKLPFVEKYYRDLLLFSTRAVESFDVTRHDAVFSISSSISKGVITGSHQPHIAYINSPARYAWELHGSYLGNISGLLAPLKRMAAREILYRFRQWDMRTPQSIDLFLANSKFIQRRIWKTYRRKSEVLYPPVDTENFQLSTKERDDFFVTASRMVPYKRIELIVECFKHLPDKRLVVIGNGPQMDLVKAKAGENVEILGFQPFPVMLDYFQRAKAFIFAAIEDFGIVPIEAQACGTPVICLNQGGTAETIRPLGLSDRPTGIWFDEQSIASICDAIGAFDAHADAFSPYDCRENAMTFSNERFRKQVSTIISECLEGKLGGEAWRQSTTR